jgi:serine/threonine protein kinase
VTEALGVRDFGPYQLDDLIGRGGMGVVYRATDRALERPVALKLLDPERAQDPSFRARFISESKLAASLDHPNVVPIHQAGEHDGVLFIAMRYVPGNDLRNLLATHGGVEAHRAVRVIAQVASALDAAHERGLVHRDVKPANVLLDRDDHVYLSDFGLCQQAGTECAPEEGVVGTADFLAPEQIRGEAAGPATDVYALACTAFNLLTGRVPFPAATYEGKLWAHLSEPPPSARVLVPALPRALDEVLARAMAKEPQVRHASAGAFADAARAAITGGGGTAATSRRPERPVAGPRSPAAARRQSRSRAAPARRRAAPPARPQLGEVVRRALVEPFNLAVLVALVGVGALLGNLALMVPLALVVYAAAVTLSAHESRDAAKG